MHSRRTILLLVIVGLFLGTPFLSSGQSQGEMTGQAWADFNKADEKLNTIYGKVLAASEDDIAREKLVASEKAWIKYRDAESELFADSARGGSMAPMLRAVSCTDTTTARIAELNRLLK